DQLVDLLLIERWRHDIPALWAVGDQAGALQRDHRLANRRRGDVELSREAVDPQAFPGSPGRGCQPVENDLVNLGPHRTTLVPQIRFVCHTRLPLDMLARE